MKGKTLSGGKSAIEMVRVFAKNPYSQPEG